MRRRSQNSKPGRSPVKGIPQQEQHLALSPYDIAGIEDDLQDDERMVRDSVARFVDAEVLPQIGRHFERHGMEEKFLGQGGDFSGCFAPLVERPEERSLGLGRHGGLKQPSSHFTGEEKDGAQFQK